VGNPDSNVAICTMWTHRERVEQMLDPTSYSVIGNLYSAAGISPIIRNVFGNPKVRYVLLWGVDLSGSGEALLRFMEQGINEDHGINGAAGRLEKEIDRQSVDLFRQSVRVIDLRHRPFSDLEHTIQELPVLPAFAEPRLFPIHVPELEILPSEITGFRVEASTVAQTWLKVLNTVMNYGRLKSTRYTSTNELREVFNMVAVVTREDPENIFFPEYLPFTKEELEAYYPEVLSPLHIEGLSYTYGQRLRDYRGVDQIQRLIDLAKARPDSKKLYASTWDVEADSDAAMTGDSPCLTQVLGGVQEGHFYFTVHFRSQDMFHGWPRNMFALRRLQALIAKEIGLPMGSITMVTHSAHIYSNDWQLAADTLEKYYLDSLHDSPAQPWDTDPRGYFLIRVEADRISATLYSPEGEQLRAFEGRTAKEVYRPIVDHNYIVMPSHLIDLGCELQKAEIALKLGIPYLQDKDLAIPPRYP